MRPVPTQPSVLSLSCKSGICLPANVCTTVRERPPPCQAVLPAAQVDACARGVQSFADPIGEVTRNGTAHLRNDGGRLGGARPPRPPPRGAAGADLLPADGGGTGRAGLLLHEQQPLHPGPPHP